MSRNTQFAARMGKAEKAKRAAELYVKGWTWDAIAKEVGYAHRSNARKAAMEWRNELPAEAVEELRRTLTERSELAYHGAREAADKLEGEERIDAEAKVARILKVHGELGAVIKATPPAVVNVTQTNNAWDLSKLSPERLAQLHAAEAEARGDASPLVSQNVTTNVGEKGDTKS